MREEEATYLASLLNHITLSDLNKPIRSNLIRCLLKRSNYQSVHNLELCLLCGNDIKQFEQVHVLTPTKKKNRFSRKLSKHQLINRCGTLYQIRSLQKLKNYSVQKLVKCCQYCALKCSFRIDKDKSKKLLVEEKSTVTEKIIENTVKKTKKRKKNDFAGLQASAVQAAKRARNLNSNNLVTPKKPGLDNNVVSLDTSQSSIPNSDKQDVVFQMDSNIISIDKTPIHNEKLDSPDFISFITPTTATPNSSVIDLVTPTSKETVVKSLRGRLLNLKFMNKNKKLTFKPKSVNKQENVVVSTEKKSTIKSKKLNSLSNLLQDDSKLNKSVSNLELFLNSISK